RRRASGKQEGETMNEYKLEHMFSYTGLLASPPEVIGPVPEGIRVNFYSAGGEITGPRVRGRLRPAGGAWGVGRQDGGGLLRVRKDGVACLDVRTTFETHDGALILVTYLGTIDFGDDGYDKFLRGEMPPVVKIRTSPRLATVHPDYIWLNRLFCLGIGEFRAATNEAHYDVYAVW